MLKHTAADARLDKRSRDLRRTMVRILAAARRGHFASALSVVEILRVLYDDVLRYDAKDPEWTGRDRCILSKGHGCLALYVMLADKGFFPNAELWQFCRPESILGGHPEVKVPGVEASTGSLGHGLAIGIGMALAARIQRSDYRVFTIIGDGESNEGSIWEGAMCAAKHELSNLTVVVDYNKQQSYGPTSAVLDLEPLAAKWQSFGFAVAESDGHDVTTLRRIFSHTPIVRGRPSCIICHTVKGRGIPLVENDPSWHHKSRVTDEEIHSLQEAVGSE